MPPMKLGMLGMWHAHANGLVNQVADHPDEFTLIGFHDPDPEVVAAREKQWKPRLKPFRLFDRPEALLKEPLDGVVVEGQVHDNLSMARLALERGLPVLLEKPAGTDLDEYRRLIDLARSKHLHFQMLYLFRYLSAVVELLAQVRQGAVGQVYEFRARLPKDVSEYERYVHDYARYKGGIFFEMASHVIDLMVTLLGRPGSVTPFMGHHHGEGPKAFVDNGVAIFGFERAWGLIEVPALEVVPHARRVEVYGSKGACVIPHMGSGHLANSKGQGLEVCRAGEKGWESYNLPFRTLQIADLREFAACVARQKQPEYSLEHDLIVQETLLQACGAV
jgi:predicted dehydrogenase